MIKIERCYKNINIKLEAIFVGDDLCAVVTGGDKPHVGAISVYSKEEGIKTISLKNHKDYIIGEIFINSIKDSFNGNISVSCGIHIDNISKELKSQINNEKDIVNEYINTNESEEYIEVEVIYEVLENIGTEEKIAL